MTKGTEEKIAKLEGISYEPKDFAYYVKSFPDGVYVCRHPWKRNIK